MIRKKTPLLFFALTILIAPLGFAQTFTFEMEDTLLYLTNPDQEYTFHGTVNNLVNDRYIVFTLTPVVFPDEDRLIAVCNYETCYPPVHGEWSINQYYEIVMLDTLVSFYIYNQRPDSDGFPEMSPIHGTYVLDVTVHNPENLAETVTHRLHLVDTSASVEPRPVPLSYELLSNYPNPFNPQTQITFNVSQSGQVKLNIYDVLGRNVADLVNSPMLSSGSYSAVWSASDLPSGSYLARLVTPSETAVHRIVLLK